MRISDLHSGLGLSVAEYFYECDTNMQEEPGFTGIRSFNRRDNVQAYILPSKPKENIEDTFYAKYEEKGVEAFNALKSLNFFFIILVQNYKLDNITVPDEIFTDLDVAASRAKELLKLYKKAGVN